MLSIKLCEFYRLTVGFSSVKQMTDALCERCTERKVGVRDIIRAGLADRYMVCTLMLYRYLIKI